MVYKDCPPDVSFANCRHWTRDPATLHLYRPVYCRAAHRKEFTRLLVLDPSAKNWRLRRIKLLLICEWPRLARRFPTAVSRAARRPHLSRFEAAYITRIVIARRFGEAYVDHAKINCKRRLSRTRRLCKLSAFAGDSELHGRMRVRLRRERGGDLRARVRYRVVHLNAYCFYEEHESFDECSDVKRGRAVVDRAI